MVRGEQPGCSEIGRDLSTAAEARHEKPQGFIFGSLSSPRGQDQEVKQVVFLSDHFHIWATLVPVCPVCSRLEDTQDV